MTPPNITKGEWKFSEKTIDGWGGDEVSFSIRDENDEPIVHLDTDRATARFLSASKAMAEALLKAMVTLSIEGSERTLGVTSWRSSRFHAAYVDARRALLQAGYTE